MKLYTIGYEGCDIGDFVEYLRKNKIHHLIDLRKNPVSRKRGFAKKSLTKALAEKEIDYLHIPALGVPREWRQKQKAGKITRQRMFSDYKKKVLPKAKDELKEILQKSKDSDLVVLCYEADASDCHRHFAAEAMKKIKKGKLKIIDLKPLEGIRGGQRSLLAR